MKHILYILLFCSISGHSYSQTIKDTIYIVFKEGYGQKKLNKKEASTLERLEPIALYRYDLGRNYYCTFLRAKYFNDKDYEAKIVNKTIFVDMAYLRNKQDKLMDSAFMSKMESADFFDHLKGKVIYIVDIDRIKKNKIPMYRVGMFDGMFMRWD